jgi:hypothetical protein
MAMSARVVRLQNEGMMDSMAQVSGHGRWAQSVGAAARGRDGTATASEHDFAAGHNTRATTGPASGTC